MTETKSDTDDNKPSPEVYAEGKSKCSTELQGTTSVVSENGADNYEAVREETTGDLIACRDGLKNAKTDDVCVHNGENKENVADNFSLDCKNICYEVPNVIPKYKEMLI